MMLGASKAFLVFSQLLLLLVEDISTNGAAIHFFLGLLD